MLSSSLQSTTFDYISKVKEELIKLEKERSDTMDKSQKEIEETHGRK